MWTILNAGEKDLEAILAIENDSFPDPWTLEIFRSGMSLPFSHTWVVKDEGGRVAGYVCFWLVMDEVHLLDLAVDNLHRRQGIGEAAVRKVIEWSAKQEATMIFLEVRESNHAARALYEKLGFVFFSRRRDYYRKPREDALVMVLRSLDLLSPTSRRDREGWDGRVDSQGITSTDIGGNHGKEECGPGRKIAQRKR
jgi:ribosomal-protein-alanine N-acetyltransferase